MADFCAHMKFIASVNVSRLTNNDGSIVTGYSADVRIECVECHVPFQFLGLPLGSLFNGAAMSADGQEARLAIAPVGSVQHPLAEGLNS